MFCTLYVDMTKTTHTFEQVEALMYKESDIIKDPNVGPERKKEALTKLKRYEKHFKDCKEKETNGHKYPERMKGFPDDKPMDKKEVLKLIDSVEVRTPNNDSDRAFQNSVSRISINRDRDLQGLMISG